MKAMVCELCGSNEIVKDGDYFVCQSCGTKYTTEAARKLLIEFDKPVEVTGSVVVENMASISNLFERAKSYFDEDNLFEAEKYINKVLDLDPQNASAIKVRDYISEYALIKRKTAPANTTELWLYIFFAFGFFVFLLNKWWFFAVAALLYSVFGFSRYFSWKSEYEEYERTLEKDKKRIRAMKDEINKLNI